MLSARHDARAYHEKRLTFAVRECEIGGYLLYGDFQLWKLHKARMFCRRTLETFKLTFEVVIALSSRVIRKLLGSLELRVGEHLR